MFEGKDKKSQGLPYHQACTQHNLLPIPTSLDQIREAAKNRTASNKYKNKIIFDSNLKSLDFQLRRGIGGPSAHKLLKTKFLPNSKTEVIAESTSKSTWFLFPTAIYYSLLIIVDQSEYLSECPVTCDLGLSSVYLGLAESSFGLTLPIFPTIIFYLCFNLCLTLCFTYFTYVLTYVKLCLTYV